MEYGARYLAKFGWSQGKGLGKSEEGIKTHVRVQKRVEGVGIGIESQAGTKLFASAYWESIYNEAAQRVESSESSAQAPSSISGFVASEIDLTNKWEAKMARKIMHSTMKGKLKRLAKADKELKKKKKEKEN
jgi:hypothetical protein